MFPNEKIIIILSGKYNQRGEICIASYHKRKEMALKYGASKVIKLPFKYSTQAAHIFAKGAIGLVAKYKIDKLLFGSETNNIKGFYKIANYIHNNERNYFIKLRNEMKKGISFPKASANVIKAELGENFIQPNDILGQEYVKEIVKNAYKIKAYCIKRTIAFHSNKVDSEFASATQLRKMIRENFDISKYSPMIIKKYDCIENYYPKFQRIVQKTPAEKLAKIELISEGMENLFKKNINAPTYDDFVKKVNSRRYTSSRIKRVMLYILLKKYKNKKIATNSQDR